MKKIVTLLRLCKPPEGFAPIGNYKFERKKVEEIDNKRHRIVHVDGLKSPSKHVDADLEYIFKTSQYLMGLVNQRYQVRIHPHRVFNQALPVDPAA